MGEGGGQNTNPKNDPHGLQMAPKIPWLKAYCCSKWKFPDEQRLGCSFKFMSTIIPFPKSAIYACPSAEFVVI